MVICGVDSNKDVHPILTDSSGRIHVISSASIFNWNAVESLYNGKVGTWGTFDSALYHLGRSLSNSAADAEDDDCGIGSFYIPLEADYTVAMIGIESVNRAKMHFMINGVDEGNIDQYNAALTYNVLKTVSLGTLTAGLKVLSIMADSRRAGSVGWELHLIGLAIYRT